MLSDDWNGPWVQIDGTAEVIDTPDAVEPLVEYYRNIAGEHPDWDEYRAAMRKQGKSLIRITPERWGPVATGGFPARLVEELTRGVSGQQRPGARVGHGGLPGRPCGAGGSSASTSRFMRWQRDGDERSGRAGRSP